MKYAVLAASILLGLVFVVFGLNFFLHFIPMPLSMGENADKFAGVMAATGYMTVVKVLEVALGAMLLTGFQRPLATILITPIAVGILLFDICIIGAPGIGLVLLILVAFLLWAQRDKYMSIVS